jgi:electron transfer flavoprotein alpha subunit
LERLAVALGGAVGYTRPVFDNGWVKDERGMIGTSGKTVRPKVYLGFGISGATHHVCGVKDAGTIISVNRDPDADIFTASDYKIVADGASVIEEMLRLLE